MQPAIHLHFPAIFGAAAASFGFGFVWYGPLFGKTWARLMGMPADFKPKPEAMKVAFVLAFVGAFLTSFVLAHSTQVWRPSVWNAGSDASNCTYGFFAGFFTWLGFYIPMLFGSVSWEGKPWSLFGLNAAYHFLNLQLIAMILASWR